MGICLTANYKGAPSLEGSCRMLYSIRSRLAKAWDYEFGVHYSIIINLWGEEAFEAFNAKTDEILSHSRFSEDDIDLIKFWFASDCSGKVDYRTCKKLADLLTSIYINKEADFAHINLRYLAYTGDDWGDLLKLLKGCYSHRANLIWY